MKLLHFVNIGPSTLFIVPILLLNWMRILMERSNGTRYANTPVISWDGIETTSRMGWDEAFVMLLSSTHSKKDSSTWPTKRVTVNYWTLRNLAWQVVKSSWAFLTISQENITSSALTFRSKSSTFYGLRVLLWYKHTRILVFLRLLCCRWELPNVIII